MAGLLGTLATLDIKKTTASEPLADGMGLGIKLRWTGGGAGAFDWLRNGAGKQRQNQNESAIPAGTRALYWSVNPRLKAE